MTPFRIAFRPGVPLCEQVVYAAKKAIVSGRIRPGDPFPSVRALSKDLKINPNTAHKVVGQLLDEGLLQVVPGIGTTVSALPSSTAADRQHLLKVELEQVVVEARKLGLGREEITQALEHHWQRLVGDEDGGRK